MSRYQQGIGIKDASESQSTFTAPTMWSEPKAPALNRVTFTPATTGANRNYGKTPAYVDTVPSRWEHGAKGALIDAATGVGAGAQKKARSTQRYQRKVDAGNARQQEIINNNPYSTSYESAVRQGQRAPQIREAQRAQNEYYGQSWNARKNDPFMTAIRNADPSSGEPTSTVEWKDEPVNPLPMGTFNPSGTAEPIKNPFPSGNYFPPKLGITSAPNSRTQNRPLK